MRPHHSLIATTALSLTASITGAQVAPPAHGIDVAGMDPTTVPGDDFYRYANGGWLKTATIPPDQATWGNFQQLRQATLERTRALMEDAENGNAAAATTERKVGDYYASFLDEATIERKGLAPLRAELDAVAAITDSSGFARFVGATQRIDVDPMNNTNFHTEHLFGLWVAPGFEDPGRYWPYMLQGGIGLPDRQYYLDAGPGMDEIRAEYRTHIAALLNAAGMADAEAKAERIFELEKKIAEAQESRVDSEDVAKANNPWARADFAVKAPGFDWAAYFDAAGLEDQQTFIVWQPAAIAGIAEIVSETPLDLCKDYLAYHLLNHYAPYLPAAFAEQSFAFYGKVLSGTPEQSARWKRAVAATNAALGEAVGRLYVERYFPPEAKAAAETMVENIIAAWRRRIDALDWMAPATKAEAQKKLAALYIGIGYPEKWRDYADLAVVNGDALGNVMRSELFEYRYWTARLGRIVDRKLWTMDPQTVNAVNLPLQIALNFPAAILQPPFFDPKAPTAANYGGIGAVIGHEISHSFDNQGAKFDARGALRNWWTKADFAHFQASADRLVTQYDAYAPFPDLHVNGRLTLGENIADLAGISSSHDAWVMSLGEKAAPEDSGFSGEQQFFLSFAQIWRTKYREAAERRQILTNEHAPGPYRAATVRNLNAWYPAFDVKPGETLYLTPHDRVQVW
jgi:putative endopeptidase